MYPMPFGFAEFFVHGPSRQVKSKNRRDVEIDDAYEDPLPLVPEVVKLTLAGIKADIQKLNDFAAITTQFGEASDLGGMTEHLSTLLTEFQQQLYVLQEAHDSGGAQTNAPFIALRRKMTQVENDFMDLQIDQIGKTLVACNPLLAIKLSGLLGLKAILDTDMSFLSLLLRGYPAPQDATSREHDQDLLRRFDLELLKLLNEKNLVHRLTGDEYENSRLVLEKLPRGQKETVARQLTEYVGLNGDYYRIDDRFRPILNSFTQLLDAGGFRSVCSGAITMRTVKSLFRGHFALFRDLKIIENDVGSEDQEHDGWTFSAKGLYILKQAFLKYEANLIAPPSAAPATAANLAVEERLDVSIEFY